MCGLWAYFLRSGRLFDEKDYVYHEPWKHASANRGPDRFTEARGSDYHLCFHRLAIHDLSSDGDQPFFFEWEDGTVLHLMCNGEIYNYDKLLEKYKLHEKVTSKSDCEIIGHLFPLFGNDAEKVCQELEGEFAFVARLEKVNGRVDIFAGRDRYGVRPLYIGQAPKGVIMSSMLAGIVGIDENAMGVQFIPGYVYHECLSQDLPVIYKSYVPTIEPPKLAKEVKTKDIHKQITDALIEAVRVRLSSEREIGFLLSGGLDSSLVVAIAVKILGYQDARTFSIGFDKNAPDLCFARKVADYLGTKHTEVIIQDTDAIKEIQEVIKATETYDITTIRASTPQYLLAKYIAENTSVRVIMNGDGSDEVSCGYLYNYLAPSAEDAHNDAIRLLSEIHYFDGLRVDRTLGAHGLEARVPFLDPKYVSVYLQTPMEWRFPSKEKKRMEKQLLRDAFAKIYPGLLPDEVMYRRKEAFSDGVSQVQTSWFHKVQEEASKNGSSEADWYKKIFDDHFPKHRWVLPHYWLPKWTHIVNPDPSARTLDIY